MENEKKLSVGDEWKRRFEKNQNSYKKYKFTNLELFKFKNSHINKTIRRICSPKKGMRVLEAGCASGKMSVFLSTYGTSVDALDISEQMLENVKELKKRTETKFGTLDVNPVLGDITNMHYEDNVFDLVINEGVVEHWLDDQERVSVIKEMVRVTNIGGYVVIIVPNGAHPYNDRWVRDFSAYNDAPPMTFYSAEKLKREMEMAGLKVIYNDGAGAWRSFNQCPNYGKLLNNFLLGMDFIFPMPRKMRKKRGVNVFAIGKKINLQAKSL